MIPSMIKYATFVLNLLPNCSQSTLILANSLSKISDKGGKITMEDL